MKYAKFLCAGVALTALAASAHAQSAQPRPEGWYIGLGGGLAFMDGTADFNGIADQALAYQSHARLSGALGYKWAEGFRVEVEPTWATNDIHVVGLRGGTTMAGGLVNAMLDIPLGRSWLGTGWSLTAGAGAGGIRVSHDMHTNSGNLFLGGHGTNFAWQLIAGVSAALRYDLEAGVDYRYLDTGATDAISAFAPARFRAGKAQTVMLSLRWYPFAQLPAVAPPPAPPPAPPLALPPAPPPPPPAPPPPPVRTFIVFFDFDKADLTAEARGTITQAVAAARSQGTVRVKIVGHTDTVGSQRYNQALSLRRAGNVRTEMVRQGLEASAIGVEGRSFNDPLVQTGPGIREPKNRRAVIDLEG